MIEENINVHERFGVWMTLTDLSKAKGVGKPALSERVKKLEAIGVLTTRPGKGKTKLINVAEFDRAIGQVTDLAREQGQATRRGDTGDVDGSSIRAIYTREQARRAGYEAEMARLTVEERLGRLVKVDELRPRLQEAVAAAGVAIDSLTHEADALRELGQGGNVSAFNRALRDVAQRIRTETASALRGALKGHSVA